MFSCRDFGTNYLEAIMRAIQNSSKAMNLPTRRQAIAGIAIAFGGVAACSPARAHVQQQMQEAQSTGIEGLLTYLHQEVNIKANPQRIYDALLDAKQFAAFTGAPAEISREAGGAFSMFGGRIVGRNVELVPHERIVQAWRPANWDPGVYSLVKFELKERNSETTVVLDHTGFPEGNFRHFDSGWYLRYWEPLKKYLGGN
jgi:activator of HSP90 ATPase